MQKIFFVCIIFICLIIFPSIAFSQPATTENPLTEKLPIEIELLYYKLQNKAPNYDDLIRKSGVIPDNQQFGQNALIAQQRLALSKIYDQSGPGQLFLIKKTMQLAAVDDNARHLALKTIDPDDPVIYESLSGDKFGVFLVNAATLAELAPPYQYEDFPAIATLFKYSKFDVAAALTLNPVAADPKDFLLADGQTVHVILAEVTNIELDNPAQHSELLQKQLKDVEPKPPTSLSKMFNGLDNNPYLQGLPIIHEAQ